MDVIENIKLIRTQNGINQNILADALSVDVSVISNIEKGKRQLKVVELDIIAKCLNVSVIDLFTYPQKYVDSNIYSQHNKVSVTFEVSPSERDQLLKIVTGTDNLGILNK